MCLNICCIDRSIYFYYISKDIWVSIGSQHRDSVTQALAFVSVKKGLLSHFNRTCCCRRLWCQSCSMLVKINSTCLHFKYLTNQQFKIKLLQGKVHYIDQSNNIYLRNMIETLTHQTMQLYASICGLGICFMVKYSLASLSIEGCHNGPIVLQKCALTSEARSSINRQAWGQW